MPRMTAARAAVEILRLEGITNVFGLPGAAINPVYRAMRDQGEEFAGYCWSFTGGKVVRGDGVSLPAKTPLARKRRSLSRRRAG